MPPPQIEVFVTELVFNSDISLTCGNISSWLNGGGLLAGGPSRWSCSPAHPIATMGSGFA